MRTVLALLAVISLLLGSTANVSADAQDLEEADCAATIAGPPCGWINPQLYLDIPDNVRCGSSNILGGDVDFTDCTAPPAAGSPIVMEGTFRLTWEVSEEATYLNDPNDPVVVSFRPTGTNPSFIDFAVEPSGFEIDTATLFTPTYYTTKEAADGSQTVWYEYTQPVTVTFTRSGEPTADDIERIQNKDGQVRVLVRIHSDSSGSTFKDSYGLEAFDFHVRAAENDASLDAIPLATDSEGKDTPMPSALFAAGAVALAALVVRRR